MSHQSHVATSAKCVLILALGYVTQLIFCQLSPQPLVHAQLIESKHPEVCMGWIFVTSSSPTVSLCQYTSFVAQYAMMYLFFFLPP